MGYPMVRLTNLCKHFEGVVAVDSINLEIPDGEFVTLLGPSGCGKTTTLRMISGLETPTSGRIYLAGEDVTHTPPEKRSANMVFQAYALFPHLTIAENIAFGPRIKGWSEKKIERGVNEMLRLVQLEGYEDRGISQLSGGQAQRVALARALINEPEVLLLDEPLGALDLKLRQEMQIELRTIQQRLKMTFVYVTHDQQEALVMSDRIAVMHKGAIIQIGAPAEIYNQPATEFVAKFIGETNLISAVVEAVNEDCLVFEAEGLKLRVPGKDDFTEGEPIWVSVRPERIHLFKSAGDAPEEWRQVFEGEVEKVFFLGAVVRYHVRLARDTMVMVDTRATRTQLRYEVGDTVFVGWEESCNILLPAYESHIEGEPEKISG